MNVCMRLLRGLGVAGFVLGGIVVGSLPAAIVTGGTAFAQSTIVVEGNRRVEADTIRSYFRLRPGERLDAAKVDEGLKGLIATGLFQDVRISQPGGRLVVTVVENPVINRVAFEGNRRVKDEQLNTELQSKPRGTLSRPAVQADVQRIVEIYRRSGRFDVRVDPKIIELPNNRVDLVFEINEGDKTGVKRINFVGNNAYSSYRLKDVIKTAEGNVLSFLSSRDLYDPDRIEADRDLLRRFYLKHGFADVRVVSAASEFDRAAGGFVVTFTIDEGPQYRVGQAEVLSNVRDLEPQLLYSRMRTRPGDVYNAEAVEKSVEDMTVEAAKRGYAFATVKPRGDRNFETRTISIVYVVEEGPRVYVERINIRGNTRTRDNVLRREFDISEGDAYNRALVDRAERRLKNLNYFKTVKITNEPGSAPDRIVINVDVEEQSTGEFSVAGGYSTADGFLAEVSVAERNLLGRGQYAKVAVQYGERARGFEVGFAEPYFLDYRLLAGIDFYMKTTLASNYVSFDNELIGGATRLGFQLREDMALQFRYSVYQQTITLPAQFNNCSLGNPPPGCYADGEASLAIRKELAQGPVLVSAVGYTFVYNTLDNNRSPTNGLLAEFKQDFAGVGGDVNFLRSTADARHYYEVLPDIVSVLRLQGGNVAGWGNRELRMLDHFQMGPNLVRGFAPAGIGPRDLATPTQDPLGGTLYWGASLEFQTPLFFMPKEVGIKGSVYADAGSLWDYQGPTSFAATGETLSPADRQLIRSSVGVGLIWDSPFGPLRFDYAIPLTKEPYDRVQQFRFGGGTKF
jgi:outer membrane protein insertion porin family